MEQDVRGPEEHSGRCLPASDKRVPSCQSADGCSWQDLPRTRFRGSLMLTVWSWEAERELFMERSAVEWQRGCCVKSSSRGAFPVPYHQGVWHMRGTEEPESGE